MFEGLRTLAAEGVGRIYDRLAREPRNPGAARVAGGSRTAAGVNITPDSAVTIAAVWAAIRYLSQTVAVLPWHAMRVTDAGAAIATLHPVEYIVAKRASSEWSSFQFRETLLHWALRWGNGYAEIERDQLGRPYALWPIHPDRVTVCRDPETGLLYYEVETGGGKPKVEIAALDMFHLRGFGEGPVGVNVIHYAAQSIGWAKAAQIFGAAFFGNGATPAAVVVNKKPLKVDGLKRQKAEFDQLFKGPRKAGGTAHLDNDADIKMIGLDIEKTQLVEVHQFLIEEICRWFGVPPHKVMHLLRATFSNIEHQAIEVVVDSITPWAKRFEDEADYKLFGPTNRQNFYTKMNMNALLRGDSAARAAFYKNMRDIGAYSVNRILELEDENTIGDDGDKHTMQSGFTTLERIGEEPVKQLAAPQPASADDDADQAAVDRVAALLNSGMKVIEHVR